MWANLVNAMGCATVKGHVLSADDSIRQSTMNQLYCYRYIDKQKFQGLHNLNFDEYFASATNAWQEMEELGLIKNTTKTITTTPLTGWLLLRVFAATIDAYLPSEAWNNGVSSKVASQVG